MKPSRRARGPQPGSHSARVGARLLPISSYSNGVLAPSSIQEGNFENRL